uniref:Uncharacterized protein n=1 Tax=Anguilla anguilla TaxID=7936 RepID=A0A0E9WWT5_ANGAN
MPCAEMPLWGFIHTTVVQRCTSFCIKTLSLTTPFHGQRKGLHFVRKVQGVLLLLRIQDI